MIRTELLKAIFFGFGRLVNPAKNETVAQRLVTLLVLTVALAAVLCAPYFYSPTAVDVPSATVPAAPESTETLVDVLDVQVGVSESEEVTEPILVREEKTLPSDQERDEAAHERLWQPDDVVNADYADPVDKNGNYPIPYADRYIPEVTP